MGNQAAVSGKSAAQAQPHSRLGGGRETGSPSTPFAQILGLQSAIGNRAVSRLLGGALPRADEPDKTPAVALSALASPGHPLDEPTRTRMEERFRHPFQHVRIHTGREASAAADALGAEAYTDGRQIVFAEGYAPGSPKGEEVLGHELGHVVAADRAGAVIDPHRITPADHASERQVSRSFTPGPFTAAPVGLALKRGEVTFREDEVEPIVGNREMAETRALLIRSRVDQVKQAAETRLLKIRDYANSAVKDFEKSAETSPDKISTFYTSSVPATLIPALVQIIRVAALGTPYPLGKRQPLEKSGSFSQGGRQGGLLHLAATVTGATLQLSVIGLLLSLNKSEEEEVAEVANKSRSLTEAVDYTLSTRIEAVREKLPQALEVYFNSDPQAFSVVRDASLSADDLLDRFGFPRVDVQSVYVPILKRLESSFTQWLVQNEKSQRFPGLFRGLAPAEEFKANQAAQRRVEEATRQRFEGPESQMQNFRRKSLSELLEP